MIEFLENIDRALLLWINGLNNATADWFFYYVSWKFTWIPFYILLLYMGYKALKQQSWLLLLFIPLLILATDQISVHLFKNVFLRYRPCHNLEIKDQIHLVNNYCGGKFGFVSSHAANTAALAMFFWLLLRNKYRYWGWILFAGYAGLISFSRIYLGAHYPFDVLTGIALGLSIGFIFFIIMRIILLKINKKRMNNHAC